MFSFSDKNILIISPESWDFVKVSKHHYARTLAASQNRVYFLNPPDPSINGIQVRQADTDLFVVDYRDPYKGVRFLPGPARKFLFKRLYKKFQQKAGIAFDVVFLFENSRFYDLDFLPPHVYSIYFQVDENQNFHPLEAARHAGLAIAINDIIQKILSGARTPVFILPHAFSGQFSSSAIAFWKGEKFYKKGNIRLRACCVGNLDQYFNDFNLLASLVRALPDVDFVFIGPYQVHGSMYNAIKDCSNVRLTGQVPADTIPSLLDEADILFFAYRDDFLSSSHKVMEYLASGKAIVTTRVLGYPEDKDLFFCSGTASQFVPLFREVCDHIEEANSPEKMKKRIQFAMDNTYKARVAQIEELINQHYNKQG